MSLSLQVGGERVSNKELRERRKRKERERERGEGERERSSHMMR